MTITIFLIENFKQEKILHIFPGQFLIASYAVKDAYYVI